MSQTVHLWRGRKFKAVEQPPPQVPNGHGMSCRGCAAYAAEAVEGEPPRPPCKTMPPCTRWGRVDGKDIIYVEVKKKGRKK